MIKWKMTSNMTNLRLLRGIVRELRYFNKKRIPYPSSILPFIVFHKKIGDAVKNHPMYGYVLDQYRRYQVTENKNCFGEDEMWHLGQTYLCLLQSVRKQEELHEQYKGTGERTVEDAAGLVGLKLPEAIDEPIK